MKPFLAKMRSRVVSEATLNKMLIRVQSDKTRCKILNAIGVPLKVINKANVEIIIYCSKK
jgi:hypothetical protein